MSRTGAHCSLAGFSQTGGAAARRGSRAAERTSRQRGRATSVRTRRVSPEHRQADHEHLPRGSTGSNSTLRGLRLPPAPDGRSQGLQA